MENKIKAALEQGKIQGAKKLASELISQEHKAEWREEKQAEYDLLYPMYRDMTREEQADVYLGYIERCDLSDIGYGDRLPPSEIKYEKVLIDYSEDESYITFNDWLNETRVVSEEVEEVSHIEVVDGFETKVIDVEYQPEVTELVRPYTPIEVTDEMIEAKFLLCGYDYKAKRKAEYPSIETYIDGIVKGDEEQVQNYINACLAVKAKYPKPEEVQLQR